MHGKVIQVPRFASWHIKVTQHWLLASITYKNWFVVSTTFLQYCTFSLHVLFFSKLNAVFTAVFLFLRHRSNTKWTGQKFCQPLASLSVFIIAFNQPIIYVINGNNKMRPTKASSEMPPHLDNKPLVINLSPAQQSSSVTTFWSWRYKSRTWNGIKNLPKAKMITSPTSSLHLHTLFMPSKPGRRWTRKRFKSIPWDTQQQLASQLNAHRDITPICSKWRPEFGDQYFIWYQKMPHALL